MSHCLEDLLVVDWRMQPYVAMFLRHPTPTLFFRLCSEYTTGTESYLYMEIMPETI